MGGFPLLTLLTIAHFNQENSAMGQKSKGSMSHLMPEIEISIKWPNGEETTQDVSYESRTGKGYGAGKSHRRGSYGKSKGASYRYKDREGKGYSKAYAKSKAVGCDGRTIRGAGKGSISVGRGAKTAYVPGLNCEWLIIPQKGDTVRILPYVRVNAAFVSLRLRTGSSGVSSPDQGFDLIFETYDKTPESEFLVIVEEFDEEKKNVSIVPWHSTRPSTDALQTVWEQIPLLFYRGFASVDNGTFVVAGGINYDFVNGTVKNSMSSAVEQIHLGYNQTATSEPWPSLPEGRGMASAVRIGSHILLCGGIKENNSTTDCLRYTVILIWNNSKKDGWSTAPSMLQPRSMSAMLAVDDTVLACGGMDLTFTGMNSNPPRPLSVLCERFQNDTWTSVFEPRELLPSGITVGVAHKSSLVFLHKTPELGGKQLLLRYDINKQHWSRTWVKRSASPSRWATLLASDGEDLWAFDNEGVFLVEEWGWLQWPFNVKISSPGAQVVAVLPLSP